MAQYDEKWTCPKCNGEIIRASSLCLATAVRVHNLSCHAVNPMTVDEITETLTEEDKLILHACGACWDVETRCN